MKKANKPNTPLEELSEEQQVDLVIVLGAFASKCKTQLTSTEDMSLQTILISCLKLYDMNFLHVTQKKNKYSIKTTEIPVSIIQHLVDNSSDKDEAQFLSSRAVYLANRFIELLETKKDILPQTKKKSRRKK